MLVCVSVRFTDACLRVPCDFLLSGQENSLPEDEVAMGTNSFLHIWLRQSVPVLVVYPPFDAPHMLACRVTCHDRTQFLREPCQVVKQRLSLFIHDILNERFHPALLRPVHISLREGSFGFVILGLIGNFAKDSKGLLVRHQSEDNLPGCLICVLEHSLAPGRIGLLLVLCHPSPMKQAPISL